MDGLTGFKEAVLAVFPKTDIQRCIIHQIRNSLKYISWKDKKAFIADLKAIYQAPTREAAEGNLRKLKRNMEQPIRSGDPFLGQQLGRPGNLLRLSSLNPSHDLYDQYRRRLQPPVTQGHQIQKLFPDCRVNSQAALPGQSGHHQKVDQSHGRLAIHPQPTGHSLWRKGAFLISNPFTHNT